MAPNWLAQFLDWLALHPELALGAIFLVAMTESLLIVGMIVPGAMLMIGAGSLIALGYLEFWSTMISAVAGAITGDGLSYWIGYTFKERLRTVWPFRNHPELLTRGELFFLRHGGKSIVFGRFVGPVRAVIPAIAGIMGMAPARFTIINVASAIAWAPAYILPGMVLGVALDLASQVAVRLGLFILAILIFAWLLTISMHRLFRWLHPRVRAWVSNTMSWGQKHPYIGWFARALIDPRQPETAALSGFAVVFLICAWIFSALLIRGVLDTSVVKSDITVYNLLQNWRTPIGDTVMVTISMLFDKYVAISVSLAVFLCLVVQRAWRTALYWAGTVAVGLILASAVKVWMQVPRPVAMYQGISQWAFPSAHVTTICVVLGFLAVITTRSKIQYRWIMYSVVAVIVFTVALSRLYLGAHWLSDVVGGTALALSWVSVVGLAYSRHCSPLERVMPVIGTASIAGLIAGYVHLQMHFEHESQRYTPRITMIKLDRDTWWNSEWESLPSTRQEASGKTGVPLTVQYAGSLDHLREALERQGWRRPNPATLQSLLSSFIPNVEIGRLPVFPNVYDQRHESLRMALDLNSEQRIILRLWKIGELTGVSAKELYIGTVTKEKIIELLRTVRIARPDVEDFNALSIFQPFVTAMNTRLTHRNDNKILSDESPDAWNGGTLLIVENSN